MLLSQKQWKHQSKKIIPDVEGIMHCLFCVNDHGQKKVLRNTGPDIEVIPVSVHTYEKTCGKEN